MPEPRTYPLVGLIGYARSGKDTLAAALVDTYDYHRIAFADPLRAVAVAVNPIIAMGWVGIDGWADRTPVRLADAVAELGWERVKDEFPEARRLLQTIGQGQRRVLGSDVWLNLAMARVRTTPGPVVITDVRYRNEARAVEQAGGILVRITRPGVGPVNDHASETELTDWPTTLTIANDGSIEQLRAHADAVHARAVW